VVRLSGINYLLLPSAFSIEKITAAADTKLYNLSLADLGSLYRGMPQAENSGRIAIDINIDEVKSKLVDENEQKTLRSYTVVGKVLAADLIDTDKFQNHFLLTAASLGTQLLKTYDLGTNSSGSLAMLTIDNIRVFDNEHDANHDAASKTATSSNGVAFSKEMSWKVDFATEECRKELLGKTIRTMARIEPTQSGQHIISAKGCGIVTFTNNKHITEGTSVAKGQTLFHISGGDLADNNLALRYQETESNYNLAKKEYERKSQLFEEQIVSESELLQAKHNFDTAEASYNNLKRTFANNQQTISTPTEGYIGQLMVRNGEYVETGQTLAVITKNNTLYVKAQLQPRNYHALKNATSANFRQTNSNKTYTLEELDGRLISYGKTISADNPLLPVVYQIKNNADFLPGTFVELYIKTTGTEENITVPNTALVEEMGNYFVYVQLTPEYFEKREVKAGTTDGKRTAILNGIKTGERIVSKGAILVKLAQTTNTLDAHAGHVH
jgi:RND family efflux transporter MFP subunit